MELLSRNITKLWKADLWFCEFCKCEISRVRGDYPFTALAGAAIRIIRCWIKEFLCEHYYDNIIQYASYCISNFITWSLLTGFGKPFQNVKISHCLPIQPIVCELRLLHLTVQHYIYFWSPLWVNQIYFIMYSLTDVS